MNNGRLKLMSFLQYAEFVHLSNCLAVHALRRPYAALRPSVPILRRAYVIAEAENTSASGVENIPYSNGKPDTGYVAAAGHASAPQRAAGGTKIFGDPSAWWRFAICAILKDLHVRALISS